MRSSSLSSDKTDEKINLKLIEIKVINEIMTAKIFLRAFSRQLQVHSQPTWIFFPLIPS